MTPSIVTPFSDLILREHLTEGLRTMKLYHLGDRGIRLVATALQSGNLPWTVMGPNARQLYRGRSRQAARRALFQYGETL